MTIGAVDTRFALSLPIINYECPFIVFDKSSPSPN